MCVSYRCPLTSGSAFLLVPVRALSRTSQCINDLHMQYTIFVIEIAMSMMMVIPEYVGKDAGGQWQLLSQLHHFQVLPSGQNTDCSVLVDFFGFPKKWPLHYTLSSKHRVMIRGAPSSAHGAQEVRHVC